MPLFPGKLKSFIRAKEELVEFLRSEALKPENADKLDEIKSAVDKAEMDLIALRQELSSAESARGAKKAPSISPEVQPLRATEPGETPESAIPYPAFLSTIQPAVQPELFNFPFNAWSQERLAAGTKTATSRTSQYGSAGGRFTAGGKTYELTSVTRKPLGEVAEKHYLEEGAGSPEEFKRIWNELHPIKGFVPDQIVYFHEFKEAGPEPPRLSPGKPGVEAGQSLKETGAQQIGSIKQQVRRMNSLRDRLLELQNKKSPTGADRLEAGLLIRQIRDEREKLRTASVTDVSGMFVRIDDVVAGVTNAWQLPSWSVTRTGVSQEGKPVYRGFSPWEERRSELLTLQEWGVGLSLNERAELAALNARYAEKYSGAIPGAGNAQVSRHLKNQEPMYDKAYWDSLLEQAEEGISLSPDTQYRVDELLQKRDELQTLKDNMELVNAPVEQTRSIGEKIEAIEDDVRRVVHYNNLLMDTAKQYNPKAPAAPLEAFSGPFHTPYVLEGTLGSRYPSPEMIALDPEILKGIDFWDPRIPQELKEFKGTYTREYYERVIEARKQDEELVRKVLSRPDIRDKWREVLLPGEVGYIERRGGIPGITERVKADVINRMFFKTSDRRKLKYAGLLPEDYPPVSLEAELREWEASASKDDIEFVKRLFGSPQAAFEIAKKEGYQYSEFWDYQDIRSILRMPAVRKIENPQYFESTKITTSGVPIAKVSEKGPGKGSIQQKMWVTDKDAAEAVRQFPAEDIEGALSGDWKYSILDPRKAWLQSAISKMLEGRVLQVTTFTGEGTPEMPLFKEVMLESVFAQPYGKRGEFWGINVKPAKGSKIRVLEEELAAEFPKKPEVPKAGRSIDYDRDITKPLSIDPRKGTITFVTKSGEVVERKIPLARGPKRSGVSVSDEALDLIDEEARLDDETMYMIGLLPLGAMGLSPLQLPPGLQPQKEQVEPAVSQAVFPRGWEETHQRVAEQAELEQSAADADSGFGTGIGASQTNLTNSDFQARLAESLVALDPEHPPVDVIAEYYPEIGNQIKEFADFMVEGMSMPGVGGPMAIKGEFSLLAPGLLGAVKQSASESLAGMWAKIRKGVPEFLKDESAMLGKDPKEVGSALAPETGSLSKRFLEVRETIEPEPAAGIIQEVPSSLHETQAEEIRRQAYEYNALHKAIKKKVIQLEEASESEKAGSPFKSLDWKTTAIAGGAIAGTGAAAITLAEVLRKDQETKLGTGQQPKQPQMSNLTTYDLLNATYPMKFSNAAYPLKMPQFPDTEKQADTAMGAVQNESSTEVAGEKSLLTKVFDVLSTVSYLEGAAITAAQGHYKWGVTPSEALGLKAEDGSMRSWRWWAGFALDVAIDPTTYLSLGTGTAARIGAVGGGRIALNPKGMKALSELAEVGVKKGLPRAEGVKKAEIDLAAQMASDPKATEMFEASSGLVLRGWGPFAAGPLKGREIELVSRQALEKAGAAPGEAWEKTLKALATSSDPKLQKTAAALLKMEQSAGRLGMGMKDKVGRAFVPFYEIRKIPRPASLAPRDPEYAERFLFYKKGMRWESEQWVGKAERLRDEAEKELGKDYKQIVAKYIEEPDLRASANLPPKALKIIETIEEDQKAFAMLEMERGLLDTEIEGYLKHMLTKEARKYLDDPKRVSTEVFRPIRESLSSARPRGYKETVEEINKKSRTALGFDWFEPDPFKAYAVRAVEHERAVESYDFLEYIAKNYGEQVSQVTDLNLYGFATRTPQLMNLLPPGTDPALLEEAKTILKKLEPGRTFTVSGGRQYKFEDIVDLARHSGLIRDDLWAQPAGGLKTTGSIGQKIDVITPTKKEIGEVALFIDGLMKGMPEGDAAMRAAGGLQNIQLPKAILEHLEPELGDPKWYDEVLRRYDQGLSVWKGLQTSPFPAYHALNVAGGAGWNAMVLGETSPKSFVESLKILGRKQGAKVYRTARGEEYTADDLIQMAGEWGVFNQPGMMDVAAEMEKAELRGSFRKAWDTAGPVAAVRYEENWMRMAMFYDRVVLKGDMPEDAAAYVSKYLFDYSKDARTAFEQGKMRRLIPFYTFTRNNIPLQTEALLTRPGKFAAFGKFTGDVFGNEPLPDWAAGYLTYPWEANSSRFGYMNMPVTGLQFYENPLTGPAGMLTGMTPVVKAPAEAVYGKSFFDNRTFGGMDIPVPYTDRTIPVSPEVQPYVENIGARPVNTWMQAASEYKTPEEKALKFATGAGTALTQAGLKKVLDEKTLREMFKKASMREQDFTYEQRFEGWKRDEMKSPLSGISTQLQGGHMVAVAEGGLPEMSNYMTQTAEENQEQAMAQVFRLGLPEKLFKQEEFWEEMESKETANLQENTQRVAKKLEKDGRKVNEAVREKIEYDAQKAINVQLYSRELSKVRMQRDWAERRWRAEQIGLAKKKAKGVEDRWSEIQIQKLEYFIPKYRAQYEEIERLREEERAKELELPEQIIEGQDYQQAMFGREDEVSIRGKGPALSDPEHIKNIIKYEDIAFDRAYILGDVAVIDLSRYLPRHYLDEKLHGKDVMKQPSGPEWEPLQERARKLDIEIYGYEEGDVSQPVTSVLSGAPTVEEMDMMSFPGAAESPAYPDFLKPGTPEQETEGYERVQVQGAARGEKESTEDLLESDEFIAAVQGIVLDLLAQGVAER